MKIENEHHLVSVALPIFNEEKFLHQTLESLLSQDYKKLEILIGDNCSTDSTPDICTSYVAKDSRIKYIRHDTNIGVAKNHILLTKKARGKYFMFAAGHDEWSQNLISECVSLLEKHESATVTYATPTWIDEEGKQLQKFMGWYDTRGLNPVARFYMVFWGGMNPILGVMRRSLMPDLKNYNFVGADLVVLSEMALKGEFAHAAQAQFFRRQNRSEEKYDEKLKRYKSREMQIERSPLSRIFPLARLPFELIKVVTRSEVSLLMKIAIIFLLVPSFPIRYILGRKAHEKKIS